MEDGLTTGDLTRGQAHSGLTTGNLDRPPARRPVHENISEVVAGGGVSGSTHAIALDPPKPHVVLTSPIITAKTITMVSEHPWSCYRSKYHGTGSPPTDQAFRVRFRGGSVNALMPSNNFEEFSCAASTTTFFWVKTTHNDAGTPTSCIIEKGETLPTDPDPGVGTAPAASYRPIAYVVTDASGILVDPDTGTDSIFSMRMDSVDAHAVVTAHGCEEDTKEIQYT